MGLRAVTGYVAHGALLAYWLWVVASTAPQLRKGTRDRRIRGRVLIIKTAALALTALVVGIIHYWATAWWQIVVALPIAALTGWQLRRAYDRVVAAPRHRLTLARSEDVGPAVARLRRQAARSFHGPAYA
jgi:membrane protein implicated in regulation of membrane protease activity